MGEEVQGRMEWGSRVEVVVVVDKVVCNDSNLKNHSRGGGGAFWVEEYAKILGHLHEKPSVSMWSMLTEFTK